METVILEKTIIKCEAPWVFGSGDACCQDRRNMPQTWAPIATAVIEGRANRRKCHVACSILSSFQCCIRNAVSRLVFWGSGGAVVEARSKVGLSIGAWLWRGATVGRSHGTVSDSPQMSQKQLPVICKSSRCNLTGCRHIFRVQV